MTDYNVTLGYTPTIGVTQQASGIVGPAGPAGVGIGTTFSVNTSGIITASYFVGDGSLLTNLPGSGNSGYANTAGIATYATTAGVSTSVIGGIASVTQLNVSGISTFTNGPILVGTSTETGIAGQNLQLTGSAYIAGDSNSIALGIGITNNTVYPVDIRLSGGTTVAMLRLAPTTNTRSATILYGNLGSSNMITGVANNVGATQAISGLTAYAGVVGMTAGTSPLVLVTNALERVRVIDTGLVGIGTTNPTSKLTVQGDTLVSGVVTASSFSGSGASLTGIIAGVGIKTSGGTVGTGATILDFRGTGISTITVASGIATINIQNATTTRTVTAFNSTAGQTTFSVTYTPGYLDVYLNGSKLSASEYTANNGTSIVLNEGASLNDVLEAVSYTTLLVTSTSSDYATIAGYSTSSGLASLATYATTAGISTTSQGLTGTPNISVGIITATDHRILSVGERTTLVNGNTVSLVYNTGGGNVAICTNPSGDIALNVTGIPTDTNFNNYSLTFSVIVSNTGTARSCTTVSLNGVSTTIKWFGGSIISAISGVTTSNGYDIYSFSGINTVGSASTTTNYTVLGSVNGGYR
jgi:hypothetical protein